MDRDAKIYIAGHRGLVGSAITRLLTQEGFSNLILRTRSEMDLRDAVATQQFFQDQKPEYVFLTAAKVGGILANREAPVDFLRDNLLIQANVMESAWKSGARKLLFLGSSCIYPKFAAQPITEESLLTGSLEPTNEWYAIAKITGIKLGQAYRKQHGFNVISLMPTNLYGPFDNFDPQTSHVLPALLRKFDEAARTNAPEVEVWGSGTPRREFLHVDDLASAALYLMQTYDEAEIVNVGTGEDLTIAELAALVAETTGYRGRVVFDPSKPDGTPRKLLDVSRIKRLGWTPQIPLEAGIRNTYEWYREHRANLR